MTTPQMIYKDTGHSDELLRQLYLDMLKPRLIEEKMLSLLRQGKVSKWFSGIGQEAIAVACTRILNDDEWIFPMHRNLGVFTSRNIPMHKLFAQWQGKKGGFTKGRDRSFHFGTAEHKIWGMISHLGPQLSLAAGIGLAHKLAGENRLALAFTGEGATSEGEFHEALNVAAVWKLPVIFVIENNGYGLSTPVNEQYACDNLADRGPGYGMPSYTIDGNNILEIYNILMDLAPEVRNGAGPVLLECQTFRMRGHEEASGTKYVPDELMEKWAAKDPILNYENYLLENSIIDDAFIESNTRLIKGEIKSEWDIAINMEDAAFDKPTELGDVYRNHEHENILPTGKVKEDTRFVDAITDALNEAMLKWDNCILMGQDIADYGGVFKITEGFVDKYGLERVRNTPLCESAILGIALGLSAMSFKSMVEMQFSDFVTCGFNQIVNNIAKLHYRWGQNADIVVRMPTGAGVAAGPFHSQSTEAWFCHVPGLKIVYPSNPADAKGLLISAFEDPNPVMYFEHKALYRSVSGPVPEGYYNTEIGKASLAREGDSISIITYGLGVHWARELTEEEKLNADILDLRTLLPLDYDAIDLTVKKTNRVLILHEDTGFLGLGAEISAYITENLFEELDAPVMRVCSLDTPVPFVAELENGFLAKSRLKAALSKLMDY